MSKLNRVLNVVGIILLLWVVISTMEVIFHNGNENYEYSKGNLWAYYDDEPKEMGDTLRESYAKGEEK